MVESLQVHNQNNEQNDNAYVKYLWGLKQKSRLCFLTCMEFIDLTRYEFRSLLIAFRPKEKGSEQFYSNYMEKSFQYRRHDFKRKDEQFLSRDHAIIQQPGWIPEEEELRKQLIDQSQSVVDFQLSSLEYQENLHIDCLTFVFGNGERSPPEFTYDSEPDEQLQLISPTSPSIGMIRFGLFSQELIQILVEDRQNNEIAKVCTTLFDLDKPALEFKLRPGEVIVAASVGTQGNVAVRIQLVLFTPMDN